MYKELNKVFNMIQTELKSEKVELGIAQDIKKSNSTVKSLVKKSDSLIDKIEKALNVYDKLYTATRILRNDALEEIKYSNKKLKDAESAAKQLGIKPSDISDYSELNATIKDLERQANRLRYPSIK